MHFVEAKSPRCALLESIENSRFLQRSLPECAKPDGFFPKKYASKCISSRRDRLDAPSLKSIENTRFLQRSLPECAKTDGFFTIDAHRWAKSRPECAKTNWFFIIQAQRRAKTYVFLHIFRMALVHLSCKMVVFVVFSQFCENCLRIAHA